MGDLRATVLPEGCNSKVTWKSSDESVVTVSGGQYNAIAPGSATITAVTVNGLTATCQFTVAYEEVESVELYMGCNPILPGQTLYLNTSVSPAGADPHLTFESSDENIVRINQDRMITGVNTCIATITATAVNGVQGSCVVYVGPFDLTSLKFDDDTINVYVGGKRTLYINRSPEYGTETVYYSSSDPDIVRINETCDTSCQIEGIGYGTATITAYTYSGVTATCTVNVKDIDIETIWFGEYYTHKQSFDLAINESVELSCTITPYGAKDTVTFTSSDPNVATTQKIGYNIYVCAVGEGKAVITATAENGISDKVEVNVKGYDIKLEKIALNEKEIHLKPGETFQLSAKVYPTNYPIQSLKWQIGNKDDDGMIATIDDNGLVTAHYPGIYFAEAYFDDGRNHYYSDSCKVVVSASETLTLNKDMLWLKPGEEYDLKATFGTGEEDPDIMWDDGYSRVASIDDNGHLKALSEGYASMTAWSRASEIHPSCDIIVSNKPSGTFALKQDSINKIAGGSSYDIWELVEGADPSTIIWRSNSPDSQIGENRYLNSWNAGEATITGTTVTGFSKSFKVVTTYAEVEGLTFSKSEIELLQNAFTYPYDLCVNINSQGRADPGPVILASSDPSIVSVEETSRDSGSIRFSLKGEKEGTAKITCTAPNGVTASASVIVKGSIRFNYDRLDLYIGEPFQLELLGDYVASPEDRFYTNLFDMNVDNETLAGIASQIGKGEIYYNTDRGMITLPYTVKQRNPFPHEDVPDLMPTSITLNETKLTLRKGGKFKLFATLQPRNTEYDEIKWFSTNRTIAYVDENDPFTDRKEGIITITGREYGTATIIVETANGLQAKVNVTVVDPANLDCKWVMEGEKKYWYESGTRQGIYGDAKNVRDIRFGEIERGREIYDPESNAWYWLDAVYDGAAAYGKEVWMPYVYQNEADWDDKEIRMNADHSDEGLKEFTYQCMKNRTGKWVGYDEKGKMLKGWVTIEGTLAELYPDQAGNTYYYDHYTGLMAKGRLTIDGKSYYFDEMTGVLKK